MESTTKEDFSDNSVDTCIFNIDEFKPLNEKTTVESNSAPDLFGLKEEKGSKDDILDESTVCDENKELAKNYFTNEASLDKNIVIKSEVLNTFKSTFQVEELTPDDEIYTLHLPHSIEKTSFLNEQLGFYNHKKTHTDSCESFRTQVIKLENNYISLAVPSQTESGCVLNLPLKGRIVIQKLLNSQPIDLNFSEENTFENKIKFPDDIKIRHPLLGADWEGHINLAIEATKKALCNKKKDKKKKKKKVSDKIMEDIHSDEYIPSKKKKKS